MRRLTLLEWLLIAAGFVVAGAAAIIHNYGFR